MMKVTKEINWHMAHRLTYHDGACRNLHGHTYKIQVTVTGPMTVEKETSCGMVCDFSDLKTVLQEEIHDVLDHAVMVYKEDKLMMDMVKDTDLKVCVVDFVTTAENMSRWAFEKIQARLKNLTVQSVVVYETETSWATYP